MAKPDDAEVETDDAEIETIEAEPTEEAVVVEGPKQGPDWSVCGQVRYLPNGEKAALRRMYLTRSYRADGVVGKLLRGARVDLLPDDAAAFAGWSLLAHAAAIISGTTGRFPYARERSLGRSLCLAGIRETPLLRLLNARGPALDDQARRIVRILGSAKKSAVPTNLGTLRELADPDPDIAERARRLIARDYFSAADGKKS